MRLDLAYGLGRGEAEIVLLAVGQEQPHRGCLYGEGNKGKGWMRVSWRVNEAATPGSSGEENEGKKVDAGVLESE